MDRLRRLVLVQCAIESIRNLNQVDLQFAERLNVISGDNGQGKTSLLEAIYLLATTKSFRGARLGDVLRHGASVGSVRGRWREGLVADGALERTQSFGFEGKKRVVTVDGEKAGRLSEYALRSPVVVFEPRQMSLTTGPPSERRKLLDRLTMFLFPAIADHRSRYNRSLKERKRLFVTSSSPREVATELDIYEQLLAEHGAAITRARANATEQLEASFKQAFEKIAAPGLDLTVAYKAGGSEDVETARQQLSEARTIDQRRKRTGFGPHHDDLTLLVNGHPARIVASQGQHRALTLALKIAELTCIGRARDICPVLLLDDVSSELDPDRTRALFNFLAETNGQIFLTTTRKDLIVSDELSGGDRRDFLVRDGAVQSA